MKILKRAILILVLLNCIACLPEKKDTVTAPAAAPAPQRTTVPQERTEPPAPLERTAQTSTTAKPTAPVATPASSAQKQSQLSLAKQAKDNQLTPAPLGSSKQAVQKKSDQRLPETACQLVTEQFLGELIGVDYEYIATKNSSGKAQFQRSCFFRWDQDDTPNAGVLLQVQVNPIADDFPEWAEHYIPSKKTSGDNAPDGSASYTYKDFDGVGEEGAYNFELSRYYWRTKDNSICMVAFNVPTTEQQQVGWAKRIAKEVMRNL